MKSDNPIIFFDGLCNLCQESVQFIIKRDPNAIFRFSSLQSDYAKSRLASYARELALENSILLLEDGKIYKRSTAALRVVRKLYGLWPMLYVFIIVPPFIRDGFYNYIAKNRYKWFGKQESCWVPTPELKEKFL